MLKNATFDVFLFPHIPAHTELLSFEARVWPWKQMSALEIVLCFKLLQISSYC